MPLELDELPHRTGLTRNAKIAIKDGDTTYHATLSEFIALLAKADVGLANVDNTTDLAKPLSEAATTALGLKADLVSGKVPSSQLPGSVDDVTEYANFAAFPATGESNKLYVTIDTNKGYRWTGSTYQAVGDGVALGETSSTAHRGDHGKTAYDHTSLTNNPHGVTKAQVGLSNVDNTTDLDKPLSTLATAALAGKAGSGINTDITCMRSNNGNPTTPTYSFASDTSTGIYRVSAGVFGITVSASSRLEIGASSTLHNNVLVQGADGSASAPSVTWIGDTDTGIYHPSANNMGFAAGGVNQMTINATTGVTLLNAPSAPTASNGTNTTQVSTCQFVQTAVTNAKVNPAFTGNVTIGGGTAITKVISNSITGGVTTTGPGETTSYYVSMTGLLAASWPSFALGITSLLPSGLVIAGVRCPADGYAYIDLHNVRPVTEPSKSVARLTCGPSDNFSTGDAVLFTEAFFGINFSILYETDFMASGAESAFGEIAGLLNGLYGPSGSIEYRFDVTSGLDGGGNPFLQIETVGEGSGYDAQLSYVGGGGSFSSINNPGTDDLNDITLSVFQARLTAFHHS